MTGKPVELVQDLIVKEGANGRRTYGRKAKRELVERCKAPGVSVAGVALAHGINANLLRRWIVRDAAAAAPETDQVAQRGVVLRPVKVIEPDAVPAMKTDGGIELTFKSITIRVTGAVDARALATVLDCLAART